jgi:PAS domain S-box-containing protein
LSYGYEMQFDFPWYSLIYIVGGILTGVLALFIWKRQFAPGVIAFTLLLLAMTVWTFSSALEAGAVEIPVKIFISKIEFLALVSAGPLSLSFILSYTRASWAKKGRNLALLWIVPILSLAAVALNELHGLVWPRVYLVNELNGVVSVYEHGPAWWLIIFYQYLLYACGIVILIRFGRVTRGRNRHIMWLLAGSLIPVAGSIVYVAGASPIRGFDLTPISICLMGVVYSFTVIRFKFMDILPAATDAFLKRLPDGFLLLDGDGSVVSLNPATGSIIGQDITGVKDRKLASFWPELDKIAYSKVSEQNIEITREQTGKNVVLNASVESFFDGFGALTGKLLILRDITELKIVQGKLEMEINKRSQFTRAIVHELRNPLSAIISSSSLLEEPGIPTEQMRIALAKNIGRSSIDLEKRVNELFDLARGELGLLAIKPDILEINSLVIEVAAEIEPVVAHKGLILECKPCQEDVWVIGDKDRLRQILYNLLGNSLKFTEQGKITLSSRLYGDNQVLVQVQDTGAGMEQGDLENLFDPYLRSQKLKTSSSGMGVGLALSKQYIELHKGRIWADSLPGKGTTIGFVVPLKT